MTKKAYLDPNLSVIPKFPSLGSTPDSAAKPKAKAKSTRRKSYLVSTQTKIRRSTASTKSLLKKLEDSEKSVNNLSTKGGRANLDFDDSSFISPEESPEKTSRNIISMEESKTIDDITNAEEEISDPPVADIIKAAEKLKIRRRTRRSVKYVDNSPLVSRGPINLSNENSMFTVNKITGSERTELLKRVKQLTSDQNMVFIGNPNFKIEYCFTKGTELTATLLRCIAYGAHMLPYSYVNDSYINGEWVS